MLKNPIYNFFTDHYISQASASIAGNLLPSANKTVYQIFSVQLIVMRIIKRTTSEQRRQNTLAYHNNSRGKMKKIHICIFTAFLLFSFAGIQAQDVFRLAKEGNTAELIKAVEKDKTLLSVKDDIGQSLLHAAILNGKGETAKYLIEKGCSVNAMNNMNETPLHIASGLGMAETASLLIERGALLDAVDNAGYTPLTNAIQYYGSSVNSPNKLEMVKLLIEKGADINKKGMWNMTPIQIAAEFTHGDIVNYLIDKGAAIPVNQGPEAYQILSAACKNGFTRLFEKQLELGFELKVNQYTRSLLHTAADGGSDKIIEKLLSLGFTVDMGDGYGWSALHSAAEKGNLSAVKLLVEKGSDINDRNASGKTPYNLAGESGHKEVCAYLVSKGADISDQLFPELTGNYMGQRVPDKGPRIFAPDIVTTKYMLHGNVVISPDGNEIFWSTWSPAPDTSEEKSRILTSRLENGKWTKPEIAPFSKIGYDDDSPFISPDGKKLFFVSRRPLKPGNEKSTKENIWYLTRQGNNWVNPTPLESVNHIDLHWQISVDLIGNLYFSGMDSERKNFNEIYCSKFENGSYSKPEKLESSVNSENREGSPYVSPAGDYLVFQRASQQGMQMGLFISFKKEDGTWTEAKSIVQTAKIQPTSQCPVVTHDGKYLFYIAGYYSNFGAFWTGTGFIEEMKKEAFKKS